jgi:hypothetical protein
MIIVQPFWNQGLKCASRDLALEQEHFVKAVMYMKYMIAKADNGF